MIITTPDHAHCAVLSGVVRAGKDAYVEKPLCAQLESAKRQIATRPWRHRAPWIACISGWPDIRPEIERSVLQRFCLLRRRPAELPLQSSSVRARSVAPEPQNR